MSMEMPTMPAPEKNNSDQEKTKAELFELLHKIEVARTDLEYQKKVYANDNKPSAELPYVYPNLSLEELGNQIDETEKGITAYEEEYNQKLKESGLQDAEVRTYKPE